MSAMRGEDIPGREKRNQPSEIEQFIVSEMAKEVSPERRAVLDRELTTVADFMADEDLEMYVAGGGGVDLFDGKWDRDHQDLDVAIFGSERRKFYEAAVRVGYRVTSPDGKSLSLADIENHKTHNAFLSPSNEKAASKFEVMFLDETEMGEIELVPGVTVPKDHYRNSATVEIDERVIPLTPPEINAFYKLIDGRRKDFRDVTGVLGALSERQRADLESYVRDSGAIFNVGGVETRDIGVLLVQAGQVDSTKHQEFFRTHLKSIESALNQDLMTRCEELVALRKGAEDKNLFIERVLEQYQIVEADRRAVIKAAADFLYQTPPPTLKDFKAWAIEYTRSEDRI